MYMWWKNDSTYQGKAQNSQLHFNSPWCGSENHVSMAEQLHEDLKKYISSIDSAYSRNIVSPNWLNSYDNPDYLWLAYELENLRQRYNESQRIPQTGELIKGHGQIPYVQIRLTQNARNDIDIYPKSTLNSYGSELKPHYVIEFEYSFIKAFITFVCSIFDDNPQQLKGKGEEKRIEHQYKAPIYRQHPFNKYFDYRHDLPGIMLHKAVQMLLAHELAHIGGGHLDLQANDPEYGKLRDTILVEEDDADAQAICWVLGIRFLEAPDNRLEISLDDFRQEIALTVFSIYMLYTWNYSKDNRVWSDEVMKKYERSQQNHLPYQLRAYNMLNLCYSRMKKLGEWSERDHMVSSDNKPLTVAYMCKAFNEAMEMINMFEHAYHMFFAYTEEVYALALDGKYDELRNMCLKEQDILPVLTKYNIPWLMGYEDEPQLELKRLHDLWPEVREKLIINGTYCKLKPISPWIPLAPKKG